MNHLDWHVGMKVVCVDASHPEIPRWPLVANRIYQIERIFVDEAYYNGRLVGGRPLLELAGIRNPGHLMHGFLASRFRPLLKRATDISSLLAILRNVREPA